jgi:hypothetical protein
LQSCPIIDAPIATTHEVETAVAQGHVPLVVANEPVLGNLEDRPIVDNPLSTVSESESAIVDALVPLVADIELVLGNEELQPIAEQPVLRENFVEYFDAAFSDFVADPEDNDDNDCFQLIDTSSMAQQSDCTLLPRIDGQLDTLAESNLHPLSVIMVNSSLAAPATYMVGPPFLAVLTTEMVGSSSAVNPSSSQAVAKLARRKKRPTAHFLLLDPDLFEKVCSMEETKSIKNERWAQNRFNSWQQSVGLDTSIDIVDLPLEEFADLLTQFFLCLCKDSGERYPSGSIGNIYDSFHRIIARHQGKMMKLQNRKESLIKISEHHFFVQTNAAVVKAMELSRDAGANKPRLKLKSLTYAEESQILNHPSHQLNSGRGILKRLLFHCMSKFLIRGGNEAYNLQYKDFRCGVNATGTGFVE